MTHSRDAIVQVATITEPLSRTRSSMMDGFQTCNKPSIYEEAPIVPKTETSPDPTYNFQSLFNLMYRQNFCWTKSIFNFRISIDSITIDAVQERPEGSMIDRCQWVSGKHCRIFRFYSNIHNAPLSKPTTYKSSGHYAETEPKLKDGYRNPVPGRFVYNVYNLIPVCKCKCVNGLCSLPQCGEC
jgi:hypothetical protein